jgi:hypothetical protein
MALVFLGACWTGTVPEPEHVEPARRAHVEAHHRCERASPEATMAPADGGYRRLDSIARDSLRAAIHVAVRNAKTRSVKVGGLAFKAVAAAVHDLRDELVACIQAAAPDVPDQRATLHMMIDGERTTGALVASLSAHDVPAAAERCIADIMQAIELPPSDGPGYIDIVISAEDPCVGPSQ